MRNEHWRHVHLEDDDGNEVEYQVHYEICPAEPDVGIFREYLEILEIKPAVSWDLQEVIAEQLVCNLEDEKYYD